jgi:hypothetical protein
VWSLGCWAVLERGFGVSLGNFELSCKRDMSHRKYADQLKIGLKIQSCDFRERNHVRPGEWATKVTGIIRHWADQRFLINKLVLPLHWGLKGTSGNHLAHPCLWCFSAFFLSLCPIILQMLPTHPSGSAWGSVQLIKYRGSVSRSTYIMPLLRSRVSHLVWKLRQGYGGSLRAIFTVCLHHVFARTWGESWPTTGLLHPSYLPPQPKKIHFPSPN